MKTKLWISGMLLATGVFVQAATNDISTLLQKGLFEEEANRNLEAAAQAYQSAIKQFDKDRKLAATAVFRLGEVYRKQGKTNEARVAHERVVREFADQTALVNLSHTHLKNGQPSERIAARTNLDQLKAEAAQLQALLTVVKKSGVDEMVTLLASHHPTLGDLRKRQREAELNIAKIEVAYTKDHPITKEAIAEREKLGKEFLDELNATIPGLEARLEVAREAIRALEQTSQPTTAAAGSAVITDEETAEIKRIQTLIKNSPDLINATDGNATPLYRAALKGQLVVAKFLLDSGAQISKGTGDSSPLHGAVSSGHKAMVELLLERGANVNVTDNSGNTPLHIAAERGYKAVAETLVANGANVDAATTTGTTPLHSAVRKKHSDIVQLLLDRKAKVSPMEKNGLTPLHYAVVNGDSHLVERLLAASANLNARSNDGTPLQFAFQFSKGSMAMVHLLLSKGADVTLPGKNGETPLHWAAEAGELELVKSFLAKGADVNVADQNGVTPLHLATKFGREDVVAALIDAGANVRASTKNQSSVSGYGHDGARTPLHEAAEYGRKDIAALLLKGGADINARAFNGYTPMDLLHDRGVKTLSEAPQGVTKAAMLDFLRERGGSSRFVELPPAGLPPSAPQATELRSVPSRTLRQTPLSPGRTSSETINSLPGRTVVEGMVYSPDPEDAELLKAGYRRDPSGHPRMIDFWQQRATADLLPGRGGHSVVWTGKELIAFGGEGMGVSYGDGARYDLESDRWSLLPAQGASPSARTTHTAVWTGKEMIVWGGFAGTAGKDINRNDGGRFDPQSNSWNPVSTKDAPEARFDHTAVWTGSEMLVWGGYTDSHSWYQGGWKDAHLNSGGRYDPAQDAWKEIPTDGAPGKRFNHVAVWTGKEMIVWGGGDGKGALNDGGRFNPATGKWRPVSTKNAPSPRAMPVAVWTGKEMIVWGGGTREQGNPKAGYFTDGGRYNPETDTWKRISAEDIEKEFPGRIFAMAVWTGSEMIVWGGVNDAVADGVNDERRYMNSGARYNPANDKWTTVTTQGGPSGRLTRGVWTGRGLVTFGGYNNTHLNDTWFYAPQQMMHPYSRDNAAAFQIRRVLESANETSEGLALFHHAGTRVETLNVEKTVLLDATAIASAEVSANPASGLPEISIKFTEEGKAKFAQITRDNIGQRLAIVVNGVVQSAPMIAMEIPGGLAQITGNFTPAEAEELAELLTAAAKR